MYEIIRDKQRLYFDIDSTSLCLDDEVKEFIEHTKEVYGSITDIVCYTSHREGKYSYHIVIQNIYARDNIQCKYYCKQLLQNTRLGPYVDMKVYRELQHFRLMGCRKLGIDNKKIVWLGSVTSLEDSLITYWREGSTLLDYVQLDYCNMIKSAYYLNNKRKIPIKLIEISNITNIEKENASEDSDSASDLPDLS